MVIGKLPGQNTRIPFLLLAGQRIKANPPTGKP